MGRCLNCIHFDVCDSDRHYMERAYGDCSDFLNDDDIAPKSEWISVEERLPERWVMVLVCCDDIISTDFISSAGRWHEHMDHTSVTHWMPLPKAPKMKGGAE